MRSLMTIVAVGLVVGCATKPGKLSEECAEILDRDTFYYALPLPDGRFQSMFRLESFLTTEFDGEAQTIDFDCLVAVSPTDEQLKELGTMSGPDFEEMVMITSTHADAAKCIVESRGIRFVEATGRFICFKSGSREWNLDLQKGEIPIWKFILFKQGREPKIIWDALLTLDEIEEYFSNSEH